MSPSTAKTYEEAISAYLSVMLEEQELEAFLDAVGHVARGRGIGAVAEHSGLGRESLYKALGKGAKPRFETVCKVMRSLGLKLVVVPSGSRTELASSLQDFRDFYARFVVASAGSSSERLIRAFASVPRENFVGPGPWPVLAGSAYLRTLSDDPALLYQDILIGLLPEKGINNGQPSLHAKCLAAAAPVPGETVVHIGAGSGYYTAVLANLVGPSGRVAAFEVEPVLADRARAALEYLANVEVHCASAAAVDLPSADVIYVNAGVTHIPAAWLDALNVGGRLVVPLTPEEGFGGMLLAVHVAPRSYAASILARVQFIPCSVARVGEQSKALADAFEPRSFKAVRSLHRDAAPDASAWYVGDGWWLSTAEPRPH